MRRRSLLAWVVLISCVTAGFVLGRISAEETTQASRSNFLPLVQVGASAQPQLEATVAALVAQNAQQATAIANSGTTVSYLATQLPAQESRQATAIVDLYKFVGYLATQQPAQNRVATVDRLVLQRAALATQVAELYIALGSPVPTEPPTPTFGPSPIPTSTAFVIIVSTTTPTPTQQ